MERKENILAMVVGLDLDLVRLSKRNVRNWRKESFSIASSVMFFLVKL
jgi:hypothetical protein